MARRPGKVSRARKRSQLWNRHLLGAQQHLPADASLTDTLLVRDAGRNDSGLLVSSKRFADGIVRYVPPSDLLPDARAKGNGNVRPLVHAGDVTATLMNGVFGDPLLHLRLRHRSLMFDLGDGSRLPALIAHQLSDIFISHAHVDHIAGLYLAAELTLTRQGVKLVYATDFADTRDNRERLVGLADGAHTLFCESTFSEREAEQARRIGHLTTRACAEIANQAQVFDTLSFFAALRKTVAGDV